MTTLNTSSSFASLTQPPPTNACAQNQNLHYWVASGYPKQVKIVPRDFKHIVTSQIQVERLGNAWRFRVHLDFLLYASILQNIRFRYQEDRIPQSWLNVRLRPVDVFPALLYLYYNSRYPETHLKKKLIPMLKAKGSRKPNYTIKELYEAFIRTQLPKRVRRYIEEHCPKPPHFCHGYMNALRFEYLRQVYTNLFVGIY
ncbi:MAG: hypothetical protein JSV51_09125 [Candidatus Bathyarchaeota archaeon]|nr:MAG: hypothetical protein JSV51_09125 [Candidatus Bathyarchaeota archaeon]